MMFSDKDFIAKKIRLARKSVKLTQEELAERIGISAKQLSRIEMATYIPSLPTFLKIVQTLNIDLKEFGIDTIKTENSLREAFIKLVYNFTDKELEYYYKALNTMVENSNLLNK